MRVGVKLLENRVGDKLLGIRLGGKLLGNTVGKLLEVRVNLSTKRECASNRGFKVTVRSDHHGSLRGGTIPCSIIFLTVSFDQSRPKNLSGIESTPILWDPLPAAATAGLAHG